MSRDLEKHQVKSKDTQAFLNESKAISGDYMKDVKKSRTVAWVFAGFAGVLACGGLASAFVAFNQPKPDPVVYRADVTTGAVERFGTLDQYVASLEEVENEYWINLYVKNREAYNYTIIQTMYDQTVLMSAPNNVQTDYAEQFTGDNALDDEWGDSRQRTVHISSTQNTVDGKQATVRFSTQVELDDGRVEPREYWIATLSYEYVGEPMNQRDRRRNPLGFQVTAYRVAPEVTE